MNENNNKYYRYQMTFPFESNKIHKSKSLKKVVKKCYGEYKSFSDINDGMFCITNLDKNTEYRFKIKNKTIKKLNTNKNNLNKNNTNNINNLFGGNPNASKQKIIQDQANEISKLDGDPDPKNIPKSNDSTNQFNVISTKLDSTNKGITEMAIKLNDTNEGINNMTNGISNMTSKLISASESEQDMLAQILKLKESEHNKLNQPEKINIPENKSESIGLDLFDGIDVFDANLRKLYAIKQVNHIDGKTENECVIL